LPFLTRSDLYVAGRRCFRLLTGRANVLKLPSRIDSNLAPAWDDFVERALEEAPQERLQSAKEGLRLLECVERGGRAGEAQTVDLGGGEKLDLVWCPPGTFIMSSAESETDRGYDETQHRVMLTKATGWGNSK
jgi:hypothetical protein